MSKHTKTSNEDRASVDSQQEEVTYFKQNEEQDGLIVRGIKLLSTKLLDLINLCYMNQVDVDQTKNYSLLTFEKWENSITAVHDELKAWEIQHAGEEQFSKCFKLIVITLQSLKHKQNQEVTVRFDDQLIAEPPTIVSPEQHEEIKKLPKQEQQQKDKIRESTVQMRIVVAGPHLNFLRSKVAREIKPVSDIYKEQYQVAKKMQRRKQPEKIQLPKYEVSVHYVKEKKETAKILVSQSRESSRKLVSTNESRVKKTDLLDQYSSLDLPYIQNKPSPINLKNKRKLTEADIDSKQLSYLQLQRKSQFDYQTLPELQIVKSSFKPSRQYSRYTEESLFRQSSLKPSASNSQGDSASLPKKVTIKDDQS